MKKCIAGLLLLAFAVPSWAEDTLANPQLVLDCSFSELKYTQARRKKGWTIERSETTSPNWGRFVVHPKSEETAVKWFQKEKNGDVTQKGELACIDCNSCGVLPLMIALRQGAEPISAMSVTQRKSPFLPGTQRYLSIVTIFRGDRVNTVHGTCEVNEKLTSPLYINTKKCIQFPSADQISVNVEGSKWTDKDKTQDKLSDSNTIPAGSKVLADQSEPTAQASLEDYDKGIKAVESDKEAVERYRLAAEQGKPEGQRQLGVMYTNGNGVIQHSVYAHMWLNIAASNGSKDAKADRDILAKRMSPLEISTAQDLARECVKKNYKDC